MTRKAIKQAEEKLMAGGLPPGLPEDQYPPVKGWRVFFFERDGDFNPGWTVFTIFCVLVMGINVVGFATVGMEPTSWPVLVALLSADVLCMWLASAMVISIARAKIIVPAAAKGVGSISSVGAESGVGDIFIDRERD